MSRFVLQLFSVLFATLVLAQDAEMFQREIAEKAGGLEIVRGGVPGTILVAGKPAFPLVAGRIGKASVPVAAASTLGKGRIVAVSHEAFLSADAMKRSANEAFLRTSLRWLAGGAQPATVCYDSRQKLYRETVAGIDGSRILAIDRLEQLQDIALPAVFLFSPESHGVEEMPKVRAFIERGGGVLCSVVGWGWHQITRKSFQTQSAFNALLGPAGLYTSNHTVSPVEGKRFAAVSPSAPAMSCEESLALAEGKTAVTGDSARQCSFLILAFQQILPEDERQYRPRIKRLIGDIRRAAVPSPKHPITIGQIGDRLALSAFQDAWLKDPVKVWAAHPAAEVYPGIPESKRRVTRTVRMNLSTPRWHGTGLFAVAGEPLTVTLPDGMEKEGLRLRIGTTTCRVTAHEKWLRAPVVDVEVPLDKPVTKLSSPFGGLVYVVVPKGKSGMTQVKIGSACPAPWFVEGRDNADAWRKTIRELPAPMAEIESGKIIFTVPSSSVRELDDPLPLLKVWSEILDWDAKLTALPKERTSAERFCIDVQLCAGYMHAGYPIMIPWGSTKHLVNAQTIRTGKEGDVWGLFHEMGHNHQNGDWTFQGTGEVTVNFFTLYCMDKLCGLKPRQTRMGSPNIKRAYENWEAAGHPYEKWKSDPFLALEFFVRLYDRFGWEPFEKMFAEYRTLSPSERPKNDYEKRKQWAQRFSRLTGKDLCPLFNLLRNPDEPEFQLE